MTEYIGVGPTGLDKGVDMDPEVQEKEKKGGNNVLDNTAQQAKQGEKDKATLQETKETTTILEGHSSNSDGKAKETRPSVLTVWSAAALVVPVISVVWSECGRHVGSVVPPPFFSQPAPLLPREWAGRRLYEAAPSRAPFRETSPGLHGARRDDGEFSFARRQFVVCTKACPFIAG
ncbi:hypothetical protein NDU88_009562 [Pleurodeles waltl]|uniref:Uncharacterized protein n=1 Tax=Pleurodeles waltl TaxID=8319 RepID=A0AAV7QRX9_PLEWA|nr:hypothetical protein NDU88_009562 [Pleurodeles waltl]